MKCSCCTQLLLRPLDVFGLPGDPHLCVNCWLSHATFHAETKLIEQDAQRRAEAASPDQRHAILMDLHASVADTPWGFIPRYRADQLGTNMEDF